MSKLPVIPARPVRPGTVAVRLDHSPLGVRHWAIASNGPIYRLVGGRRQRGQSHAGLWVYGFSSYGAAARGARTAIRNGWVPA